MKPIDVGSMIRRQLWMSFVGQLLMGSMAKAVAASARGEGDAVETGPVCRAADAMLAACLERFPLQEHETTMPSYGLRPLEE